MAADYDSSKFPPFAVTVDLVVFSIRDDALKLLLIKRGEAPFKGKWALPGGFVKPAEDLTEAAARELREETSLRVDDVHLEQLKTYGSPKRDPRMRVVSVAHLVLAPDLAEPRAGSDAHEAHWVEVGEIAHAGLAFDHATIVADALERARSKLEYSSIGTAFCDAEFTVAELRRVYEIVWDTTLDPRNFHRKVTGAHGFLEPTGSSAVRTSGRPAELFRPGPTATLNPAILRTG